MKSIKEIYEIPKFDKFSKVDTIYKNRSMVIRSNIINNTISYKFLHKSKEVILDLNIDNYVLLFSAVVSMCLGFID